MTDVHFHWFRDEVEDHNTINSHTFDTEIEPQQDIPGKDSPIFYHCKLCQTSFPTIERFNLHNSFHEDDGRNTSSVTDENSQTRSVQIEHNSYTCHLCGAAYSDQELFDNHVRIHAGRNLVKNNKVRATVPRKKKSKKVQSSKPIGESARNQRVQVGNAYENFITDKDASGGKTFTNLLTSTLPQSRNRPRATESTQHYNLAQDIENTQNSSYSCLGEKSQDYISGLSEDTWQSAFCIESSDITQSFPPIYTEDTLPSVVGIPCVEPVESQNNTNAFCYEKFESNRPREQISSLTSEKKVRSRACKEVPAYVLEEKPHECVECGARFSREGGLQEHIRTHTGEKPFKCNFCNAAFVQKGNLLRHVRVHTKTKPFKCFYCPARFSTQGSLQNHTRIHTGETPYKCDYCDTSFAQLATLRKHTRVHTGEKKHKCPHCQALFAEKSNLTEHMHIHENSKPFECDLCGALFSTKRNLQYHGIVHSNEKQFQCPHCKVDFRHRTSLHKHVTNIHPRA